MLLVGIILRLTHTGKAGDSVFISDLGDGTDSTSFRKVGPVYVPRYMPDGETPGYVDLTYSTDVALSFRSRGIRKFIEGGYLVGEFLFGPHTQQAATGTGSITGSSYTVRPGDRFLRVCQDPATALTIQLPSVLDHQTGRVFILDARGVAAANNITVLPAPGETVNGGASAVIAMNYGYLDLYSDCVSDWHRVTTGGGGGGVTDHTALTSLIWTASAHTGDANTLAGFNGSGSATYLPTAVTGDVSGSYPGPLSVSDLTIAGESQGSLLYFDGAHWVQLPPGAPGQALTTQGAGASPSWSSTGTGQLLWGASRVGSTVTTRYLTPGYDNGLAQTIPTQIRAARAGALQNLRVRHNVPAGNGSPIVYTLRVNGVASALVVSLASTSADASDLVATVAVAAGDLLDFEVTKGSSIGRSPTDIVATVEFV